MASVLAVVSFQSTLPCGSDLRYPLFLHLRNISIHAPLRERPSVTVPLAFSTLFQSTLPCGSDFSTVGISCPPKPFQSTLPCGSDQEGEQDVIYAIVFQSTLPCGSDSLPSAYPAHQNHFNPRSLAGATPCRSVLIGLFGIFQSTLPCGSDFDSCAYVARYIIFQSTLPCGSDIRCVHEAKLYRNFNPRSLAGATKLYDAINHDEMISIHAPLRERLLLVTYICPRRIFQSTLPCGSDINKVILHSKADNFNPRSLAGATFLIIILNFSNVFQSTLPCGSDVLESSWVATSSNFNPRSLAGATAGRSIYG